MRSLLSLALICLFSVVEAQEVPEFGTISLEDFRKTKFDSISSSVILFDKATYVDGFHPTLERHVRIKIITRDALNTWGDFKLGNFYETTTKVSAATYYVEEGEIVSHVVEKDAIYKDVKSNREKIVSLTNLREGCIVELKYKSILNYFGFPSWFIQDEVPVLWSEYLMIASSRLTYVLYGDFQPFIFDPKYKGLYNRWVFKNIPAFKIEPLMPPVVDYFARIEFWSRANSFGDINNDYLRSYAQWEYKFQHFFTKRRMKLQLDSLADPIAKLKFISNHVKKTYGWTGDDGFLPQYYSTMFEDEKGNSGELNVLLYGLLDWTGFMPEFVLLSTKENGQVRKEVPSLNQFNYVLCRVVVDGKEYLLDASDLSLPFNMIPARCLDVEGLVISKTGFRWMAVKSDVRDKINVNAWLSITPTNSLQGRWTVAKQGLIAVEEQKKYTNLGDEDYMKESVSSDWIVDSTRVTANNENRLIFTLTHYGSPAGNISATGNKVFVDPYLLIKEDRNTFIESTRNFPVQFERQIEKTMIFNLAIPDGYRVETMPANQAISLADKSITSSFKVLNDGRNVVVIFVMTIQKVRFDAEEYGNLRAYFDRLISKQNEMIVFVKN